MGNVNICICCSMGQLEAANDIANNLRKAIPDCNTCTPSPIKEGHFMSDHRKLWLTRMDKADLVLFLQKPDGSLGESTGYELAYCMHTGLPHLIIGGEAPYKRVLNSVYGSNMMKGEADE